jgi:hypothetical protein
MINIQDLEVRPFIYQVIQPTRLRYTSLKNVKLITLL